tara:strand:+ start:1386 stop:1760 length:375 start_codon:yes stop_codon:yes gene_type:complete
VKKLHISNVIEAGLSRAFEWGKWDCCIFTATCCEPSFVHELYGRYSTQSGAFSLINEMGGFGAKLSQLGWVEISREEARTGDIACIKRSDTMGVVEAGQIVLLTKAGITKKPIERAKQVWRKNV